MRAELFSELTEVLRGLRFARLPFRTDRMRRVELLTLGTSLEMELRTSYVVFVAIHFINIRFAVWLTVAKMVIVQGRQWFKNRAFSIKSNIRLALSRNTSQASELYR